LLLGLAEALEILVRGGVEPVAMALEVGSSDQAEASSLGASGSWALRRLTGHKMANEELVIQSGAIKANRGRKEKKRKEKKRKEKKKADLKNKHTS
jgi:hypothetical protein